MSKRARFAAPAQRLALPPPRRSTTYPCVAGAHSRANPTTSAARGGGHRKRLSANQGDECTVDAVTAEAYNEASGSRVFLVAWSTAGGQAQPVPTWEPESNLAGAQEAITDFKQSSRTPLVAEKQAMQSGLDTATNGGEDVPVVISLVDDDDDGDDTTTGAADTGTPQVAEVVDATEVAAGPAFEIMAVTDAIPEKSDPCVLQPNEEAESRTARSPPVLKPRDDGYLDYEGSPYSMGHHVTHDRSQSQLREEALSHAGRCLFDSPSGSGRCAFPLCPATCAPAPPHARARQLDTLPRGCSACTRRSNLSARLRRTRTRTTRASSTPMAPARTRTHHRK